MRKLLSTVFALLLGTLSFAQSPDMILGVWLTQNNDCKVTIAKDASGKYYGEITWLKEPMENGKPKMDDENPDPTLRTRTIIGLRMLEGFEYSPKDKEWVKGTIYDPVAGKTYKSLMWFGENPDKLSIKGYIGFSFIGREVVWSRDAL